MQKESRRRENRNRISALGMVLLSALAGAFRVCRANPVNVPRPGEIQLTVVLNVMMPITAAVLGGGLFLLICRLFHLRRKPTYRMKEQFAIIGLIISGFLLAFFLIGFVLFYIGLKKGLKIYFREYGSKNGELIGIRRVGNMLAAVALLVAVNLWFDLHTDFVNEHLNGPLLEGWSILMDSGESLIPIFNGNHAAGPVIMTYIVLAFAGIWLFCFLSMLVIRLVREKSLKSAVTDGIGVFCYILLGHCTLWLWIGIAFYGQAIWYGVRTLFKYWFSDGAGGAGKESVDEDTGADNALLSGAERAVSDAAPGEEGT